MPETETFEPPKTRPKICSWGGSVLQTFEEHQIIVRERGEDHIAVCKVCRCMFFHNKPTTDICHGCWYVGELDGYENQYRDVFDALQKAGYEPFIQQTGGMCMVIQVPMKDGWYAWFGDSDGPLSWERDLKNGWMVGVYPPYDENDEDWDGMPITLDGDEYLSAPYQSADFAVGLMKIATEKLEEHLS